MKLGQWDTNTIYNVDALELLKGLPDGGVDAIITDPPYGLAGREFIVDRSMRRADNQKQRGGTYKAINEAWDKEAPVSWFSEAERVIRPGGAVLIFAGRDSVYTFGGEGLKRGWHLINDITWKKLNPVPCFTGRQLTMATERILWFCPSRTGWTYNSDVAKAMNRGVNLQDVWEFDVERGDGRFHPAQKPLRLLERMVDLFTLPDELIVDPFSGSGTTSVAAVRRGRRYLGSELSEVYCSLARARIALPFDAPMFAEATP